MVKVMENPGMGYFIIYKMHAIDEKNALEIVFLESELIGKELSVEEVDCIGNAPVFAISNKIIEKSGKSYFSLND